MVAKVPAAQPLLYLACPYISSSASAVSCLSLHLHLGVAACVVNFRVSSEVAAAAAAAAGGGR
jgi:hypothetical protein